MLVVMWLWSRLVLYVIRRVEEWFAWRETQALIDAGVAQLMEAVMREMDGRIFFGIDAAVGRATVAMTRFNAELDLFKIDTIWSWPSWPDRSDDRG